MQFNLNLLKITLRPFNRPKDVLKEMKMNILKTNNYTARGCGLQ